MTDEIETDRQAGCAHPRDTFSFFGHDNAEAHLAQAITSGNMHHAWLLTGPDGVGKATLAYRAARVLLGAKVISDLGVDETDPISRQISAQSHPDLLVLRKPVEKGKAKTAVTVDEARKLPDFFAKTASVAGGRRVAIIDTADDMNENAANAILKTLEEPPPNAVLFLLASTPGRLLPTIRSRCRTLRLSALPADVIRDALRNLSDFSSEKLDIITKLSGGAPGKALALASSNADELFTEITSLLTAMPEAPDGPVLKFADRMKRTGAEPAFELTITTLSILAADLAKTGANQQPPIIDITPNPTAHAWANLHNWSQSFIQTARGLNLDKSNIVLRLFDEWRTTIATAKTGLATC